MPAIAARVANEYVTSILQQNIQSRTNRAAETSKFFEAQVASLEHDLAAQEAKIVDFKNKNQDALAGDAQLASVDVRADRRARSPRSTAASRFSRPRSRCGNSAATAALDPAASNSTEAQLNALRMQLVQLRAVDSDTHPDVVALDREDRGARKSLCRRAAGVGQDQARPARGRAPMICALPISTSNWSS